MLMKKFTLLLLLIMSSVLFSKKISAQDVKLITDQCEGRIFLGTNLISESIKNVELYEFYIYTEDSSFNEHFISHIPQLRNDDISHLPIYKNLNVKIRTKINNNWNNYGESCQFKIVLDCGFTEIVESILNTPEKKVDVLKRLNSLSSKSNNLDGEDTITIPIVFHVIVPESYTGINTYEYLSPAKINEAICILNDVFLGKTSEFSNEHNTKIKFCPAVSYYDSNNNIHSLECNFMGETYYGITYNRMGSSNNINIPDNLYYPQNINTTMYNNDYYNLFPTNKYLSIWIFDKHPLGFAGQAMSRAFTNDPTNLGHVVIIKNFLGTNLDPSKIKGYTLPHEVGHYFGLQHTWGDLTNDKCNIGDAINDTEPHERANATCYERQTTCASGGIEPIYNIMNYSPDACRHQFTIGQAIRMRDIIASYYPQLPIENRQNVNYDELVNCKKIPKIEKINIYSPTESQICSGEKEIKVDISDATNYYVDIYKFINNNYVLETTYSNNDFFISNNYYTTNHIFTSTGQYKIELIVNINNNEYTNSTYKIVEVIECNTDDIENWGQSQWHFDTKLNLSFSNGFAEFGYSNINALNCETSVCNQRGELLFYTNGKDIWDHNHNIQNIPLSNNIPNPKGVIALPIDTTNNIQKYMVIFFDNNHLLNYKIINVNNTNYSLNIPQNSQPLLTQSILNINNINNIVTLKAKGLSACPKTDGSGYWIFSTLNSISNQSIYNPITIEVNSNNPTNINNINTRSAFKD